MPSFLPHAVAPALVAAAFFPVPRRTTFLFLPMVWAPDLDYLVQSQHRAVTHSIFIPLALLVAVAVLWRLRDPAARFWEFATRPGWPVGLSLSSFYIVSHLLMDVFAGGVVLLWPFTYTNFYMDFQILLETGSNTFEPTGSSGTEQGTPEISATYPWLSYVDTAVAAFLAACLAGAWGVRRWRKARGTLPPRPVRLRREATLAAPIQKP
ncbi:MAG TPA: metal-dependent hydrolase [Candidatus Thermoplasmatota archaeon]|nr:metal-dependent hydrolase [Candidatus Thermoplasmatota archaeon]